MTSSTEVYPLDCFSLQPIFGNVVLSKICPEETVMTMCAEFANGMAPREYISLLSSPLQNFRLRSSLLPLVLYQGMCFISPQDVLEKLLSTYDHNSACPVSERRRFDTEIPITSEYEYSICIMAFHKPSIYARHPTTNEVTRHDHPYPNLPRVSMQVHPAFATLHAYNAICTDDVPASAMIVRVGRLAEQRPSAEFIALRRRQTNPPRIPQPSAKPHRSSSQSSSASSSSSSSASSTSLVSPLSSRSSVIPLKKRKREEVIPAAVRIARWLPQTQQTPFEEVPVDDAPCDSQEPVKEIYSTRLDRPAWRAVLAKRPNVHVARCRIQKGNKRARFM